MVSTPPLLRRPDLAGMEPYVSPQMPARVRMNTNESPYPPPRDMLEEVARSLVESELNRYPNRDADELRDAVAAHVRRQSDGIWIANGSNEVLLHLFLTFGGPGRRVLVFEPTYSLHSLVPRIAGTEVVRARRGDDFSLAPAEAVAAVESARPDIVMLCSPNNPTGACERLDTLEAVLAVAPGVVVVDEAYVEFAGEGRTVVPLLGEHPNLAVTRTFSKAWRLAGARIGYLVAAESLVAELATVRLPYHLSSFTQLVGRAILSRYDETLDLVRRIVEQRDALVRHLRERGLQVFPSDANFVLFAHEEHERLWRQLLDRGVLVRHMADLGCLRVTAGLPEETEAFVTALEASLAA